MINLGGSESSIELWAIMRRGEEEGPPISHRLCILL